MKKLLTLVISLYALNLTGCTSVDMERQEQLYQDNQRYNKMMGMPKPCQPIPRGTVLDNNGNPVPSFGMSPAC